MVGRKSVATPVTKRHTNGNEAPPPSTYAAQLVQNHAPDARGGSSDTSTTFAKLLDAILHSDIDPETDADINYKVIKVVTGAGLDTLPVDDPFAAWDKLLPQAIDSVAVIETTIVRQPGLLVLRQEGQNGAASTPMIIWLFAGLLRTVSNPKSDPLQPHVERLLSTILSALAGSLDCWQYVHTSLQMYQDAVDEIIQSLEKALRLSSSPARSFEVKLPTAPSIVRFSKTPGQAIFVSSDAQTALKSGQGAVDAALLLMSAMVSSFSGKALGTGQVSNIPQAMLLKKIQDAVSSLGRIILTNRTLSKPTMSFDSSATEFLHLLSDLCSCLGNPKTYSDPEWSVGTLLDCVTHWLRACIENPFPAETQIVLAESLHALWTSGKKQRAMSDQIAQLLSQVDLSSLNLSDSLQHVLIEVSTPGGGPSRTLDEQDVVMLDADLSIRLEHAIAPMDGPADTQRSRSYKNRPLLSYHDAATEMLGLFGKSSDSNNVNLSLITKRAYNSLDSTSQEKVWSWLTILPCLAAKSLNDKHCQTCQNNPTLTTSGDWKTMTDANQQAQLATLLRTLISIKEFQESARCRTLAAFAVRSYVIHCQQPEQLDLRQSALGEWCFRSLTGSSRDLRFAAGRAVAAFLRDGLPSEVRDSNRRMALEHYRALSGKSHLAHSETMIYAWGQVIITCGYHERNLALLQLVEYLGHSNHFINSLAANELEQCAATMSMEPSELCKPFLGSLACSAIRDVAKNPKKTLMLCEFLRTAFPQFLKFTQKETIPFLVLTKKKDALQRIASSRSTDTSVQDIIVKPSSNFAAVLALLLSQPNDDPEGFTAAVLSEYMPNLTEDDLIGLIRMEFVPASVGMLKYAGEQEGERKASILKAIQSGAVLCESQGKSRSSNMTAKVAKSMIGSFFENHVLGMMTQFSETIERQDENVTTQEKARCLKGIEEMISLAKLHVSVAVPQIRACLQSAIDQGGLVEPAVSAWLTLMSHLDDDNLVPLLDHLFSIIVQQWHNMPPDLQQRTYDTVAHLLKTQNDLIREKVITVPSLADIPLMSKFHSEIQRLKATEGPERLLEAFVQRLLDENASIVLQAARELYDWLVQNQTFIHESAVSESPPLVIASITRALLDACVKYNTARPDIANVCSECLGAIGCLDPNRIEANVSESQIVVLSNFEKSVEVINWISSLLSNVFVPAFRSATNARAQGFLAFAMQELAKACGFEDVDTTRLRSSQANPSYEAWLKMPEHARNTLIPFLSSRYSLRSNVEVQPESYPIFTPTIEYGDWLRRWVCDMLWRGKGDNAKSLFALLARFIKQHDISIAKYLLPYVALNITLGGTMDEANQVGEEMVKVLSAESTTASRQCSEDIFSVLDYMSRWIQEKRLAMGSTRIALIRAGHSPDDEEEMAGLSQISTVESVVLCVPADIIAQRAIECGSYARALFHWENHIRERSERGQLDVQAHDEMYRRLQSIYSEIDEPDGMDGIAAYISALTPEQQAAQDLRAGRWSAAQSWYEIELAHNPDDHDMRVGLLTCLQRSGQSNQTIRVAKDMIANSSGIATGTNESQQLVSFIMDASFATNDLKQLSEGLQLHAGEPTASFSIGVGDILTKISKGRTKEAGTEINSLRGNISRSLTAANSNSLAACHTQMLQLHILYEIERMTKTTDEKSMDEMMPSLERRLEVLGSFTTDKQMILAIRRTLLKTTRLPFDNQLGKSWLTTAKLARKADVTNTAHFAVLNAVQCNDPAAVIEQARLMWKSQQHRQAIQILQKAIDTKAFTALETTTSRSTSTDSGKQNLLAARANLLLAKWLDSSGQQQVKEVTAKYQHAARYHAKWEKGHYYLAKHYTKILEANMKIPFEKREVIAINGEVIKMIVENFLRSMPFGCKYWHQTIPKFITLWLGLGMDCLAKPKELSSAHFEKRKECLSACHAQLRKYIGRVPRYAYYTALPQLISRISHPHSKVADMLSELITAVVSEYPAQALWALLPVSKASSAERATRGKEIVARLRDAGSKGRGHGASLELRAMVHQGSRLQDGLLFASEVQLEGRAANVSLSRDLGFSSKLSPSPLVVPFQHLLTPHIPTVQDTAHLRAFKPFANDKVTIESFSDDVLVLNSLQRPRKLTLRGSDGKQYGLLCKPKDDLRKDQRLMEFNTMINRALKRDPEASKRHLYIKTYGVTPLSEESGCIEWVEGIKPLRDILLKLYQRKGVTPNYAELKTLLATAASDPSRHHLFTTTVLSRFPPVLHEWFTELHPAPAPWFASRLRYTRSCAVMSMVGYMLGLGDRHGENILLEESSGGVFHVDFNCLFDKGLTFEKPELVPFRLTHNMRDAMGATDVEGPFTKSAELTIARMRADHDALVSVLETFVHDPTTDFIGRKKRVPGVPDTPQAVIESVSDKLRGYLGGDSVPLGTEGLVQALIGLATDEGNLAKMYIGWCAFL